jgi:GR25 family glycosyltransferase involved in LPS biosynthesis
MFNFFEKVHCINLTSREDRWERCKKEFSAARVADQVNRFPAVNLRRFDFDEQYDVSVGPYSVVSAGGCLASHRAIIQEAKDNGLKNVLVLEDDVSFILEATDEFLRAVEDLKNQDWALFYLGATVEQQMGFVTENLFKTTLAKATHAIAYNHTIYDEILGTIPEGVNEMLKFVKDRAALDDYYVKEIQPRYNCYICNPMFVVQGRSFSDIVQMNIDYSHDQLRFFQENLPEKCLIENHK